jgi:hypothetical protein
VRGENVEGGDVEVLEDKLDLGVLVLGPGGEMSAYILTELTTQVPTSE